MQNRLLARCSRCFAERGTESCIVYENHEEENPPMCFHLFRELTVRATKRVQCLGHVATVHSSTAGRPRPVVCTQRQQYNGSSFCKYLPFDIFDYCSCESSRNARTFSADNGPAKQTNAGNNELR